jgi:hypothetical protein
MLNPIATRVTLVASLALGLMAGPSTSASATPDFGDGDLDVLAALSCHARAYQLVPFLDEDFHGEIVEVDITGGEPVSETQIFIEMSVSNAGPAYADELAIAFHVWGDRTPLLDEIDEIVLANGGTYTRNLTLTPAEYQSYRRVSFSVEADLDDLYSGAFPTVEHCGGVVTID